MQHITSKLSDLIEAACASTKPNTKERNKALLAVKWKLREKCGLYAGLDARAKIILVSEDNALVFSGCDNEEAKIKFYNLITGGAFEVEVCAS